MANKICKKYDILNNIIIPDDYKIKDLSDYIAYFKSTKGLKTLINLQT